MPTLTIRSLTEEDLRWLRVRAATHGRSLNAEVLDLLRVARVDELADAHPDNAFAHSYRRARRLSVRTPSTSRATIRSDRDRDQRLRR
jgi:plasmid stability protein